VHAEEEIALAVLTAGRNPVIVPIAVAVTLAEISDHFLDGVEAVNDETIAEQVPARVLAALHADVDHDEWLGEKIVRHDPSREARVPIEAKVHGSPAQPSTQPSIGTATCLPAETVYDAALATRLLDLQVARP